MDFRKYTAAALTAIMALSSSSAFAEDNTVHVIAGKGLPVKITIADEKHYDETSQGYDSLVFSDDTLPFVDENGRVQIPVRRIAEELDFTVDWNDGEKKITLSKSDYTVIFNVNSKDYTVIFNVNSKDFTVNGTVVSMDTAPVIINGRAFIPLRYLCEAAGYAVEYTDRNMVSEAAVYTTAIEDMWNFDKYEQ